MSMPLCSNSCSKPNPSKHPRFTAGFRAASGVILILASCGSPTGIGDTRKPVPPQSQRKTVHANIKSGDDVYVIFTNPSTKNWAPAAPSVVFSETPPPAPSPSTAGSPGAFGSAEEEQSVIDLRLWETGPIKLSEMVIPAPPTHGAPPPAMAPPAGTSTSAVCSGSNRAKARFSGIQGDPVNSYGRPEIRAECRKRVTADGITLDIYVDVKDVDVKDPRVTDEMVTAMADRFLKAGPDNDIYDWITDIYGKPWGAWADKINGKGDLLLASSAANHITILLYDIRSDGPPRKNEGRTVGYFDSRNNFNYLAKTNRRLMFAMDSALLAKGDELGAWSASHPWPQKVFSTLAHEFQHMIHFYQKLKARYDAKVPNRQLFANSETWLNEMASEAAQDLIADKMKVPGPRGVPMKSDGSFDYTVGTYPVPSPRLVRYNARMDFSFIPPGVWRGRDSLLAYASVYAFGAYLTRNYGGAALFRNIVQSPYTDEQAVLKAIQETTGERKSFEELLIEWAKAAITSDTEGVSKTYNFPGTAGRPSKARTGSSIEYRLGAINLYNYEILPRPFTRGRSGGLRNTGPGSNAIFHVGENLLAGSYSWQIDIPNGMRAEAFVKKNP